MLKVFIGSPRVELVFVMVVFPLIINVILFWVQDNILKAKERPEWEVSEAASRSEVQAHKNLVDVEDESSNGRQNSYPQRRQTEEEKEHYHEEARRIL